ncbi:MAG TPA: hypothetical protein VJK28_01795, partial [Nitrospiria bacterium]|nr:hypothetical protein [Nitrospiria bacterium]
PGPEEFYNGANESSTDPPDTPTAYTEVAVSSTVSDVNIVINGPAAPNNPPELASVGDQSLEEGSTLDMSISAADPEDDPLTFSITNAPDFATLTDNSDGTATLHLAPTTEDAGTYGNVVITVSDDDLTDSETITIVVTSAPSNGGDSGDGGGGGGGCGGFGLIEGKAEPPGTALGFLATLYLPLLLLFIRRRFRNRISVRLS